MPQPRLHAPREHGEVLAIPALADAGALLAENRAALGAASLTINGRPLAELRSLAATEALSAAQNFHARLRLPVPPRNEPPLIVTGHQPELFHPGVWAKNFAAHGLARTHAAAALNLVIDSDIPKTAAVRVPVITGEWARLVRIPYDRWSGRVPYEEWQIRDRELFESFRDRVASRLPASCQPALLDSLWRDVIRLTEQTASVGELMTAARRLQEERLGCQNFEMPLSDLCRTEAFACFAVHLLWTLPGFWELYNGALRQYRIDHDIRSSKHPLPDLARDGDWLEAPFWIWRQEERERRRLFAASREGSVTLRGPGGPIATLPPSGHEAVQAFLALDDQGWKVRPRALMTTLFARVFLADLFIHGIGGALYDDITDRLIRKWLGLPPPGYLVLSATVHLPLGSTPAPEHSIAESRRLLRDLWYNPQRHPPAESPLPGDASRLIQAKQHWIERADADPSARRARFRAIRELNEALRPLVAAQWGEVKDELDQQERAAQRQRIQQGREYAYCLYPEPVIKDIVEEILRLTT